MACVHPENKQLTDYHSGDIVCMECGMVLDSSIMDDRPQHTKDYVYDNGDSAEGENEGFIFNTLAAAWTAKENSTKRTFLAQRITMAASQEGVSDGISRGNIAQIQELGTLCDRIPLSTTVKNASISVLKDFWKNNTLNLYVRDKHRDYLSMACVYHACKTHNVSRSFSELSAVCGAYEMNIRRAYKHLHEVLPNEVVGECAGSFLVPSTTASMSDTPVVSGYFSRWCSFLGFAPSTAMECKRLFSKIPEELCRGRKPTVIAAAVVCLVAGKNIKNQSLKEVCKVTPQSARQLATLFRNGM
jgi:transcription initiation factor TFIIB